MGDNTFMFIWREVSPWEAIRWHWRKGVCWCFGHRWHRHSWYESWDDGAGFWEYWWVCETCEKFSKENPL